MRRGGLCEPNSYSFAKLWVRIRVSIVVSESQRMKPNPDHKSPAIEDDAVWSLLENASKTEAGPRFADDVVRMARLDGEREQPWWRRWFAPVPAATLAGAAAALVFGVFLVRNVDVPAEPGVASVEGTEVSSDNGFAHLQEVLETEMLLVAVERLDDFSDEELLALIGF